jgi:hypothetical protein
VSNSAPKTLYGQKAKTSKSQRAGTCIFCGSLGLSHEHIWPDWLRNYIPRTMNEHRTMSAEVYLYKEETSLQRRTGDPHSRRIYCVCGSCNSGWMSRLQEQARPFLVPMLTGEKTSFHRRGQTTLASWIAMTIMVAEHVDRKMVGIPSSDRVWLREHQKVPSHWRIWIGRHHREQHPMFTHRVLPFAPKEKNEGLPRPFSSNPNTQTSTICLGEHLLIHVMSSIVARGIIRRWKLPAAVNAGLIQIWPIKNSPVFWPPETVLADAGIDFMADDFFKKAAAVARDTYSV